MRVYKWWQLRKWQCWIIFVKTSTMKPHSQMITSNVWQYEELFYICWKPNSLLFIRHVVSLLGFFVCLFSFLFAFWFTSWALVLWRRRNEKWAQQTLLFNIIPLWSPAYKITAKITVKQLLVFFTHFHELRWVSLNVDQSFDEKKERDRMNKISWNDMISWTLTKWLVFFWSFCVCYGIFLCSSKHNKTNQLRTNWLKPYFNTPWIWCFHYFYFSYNLCSVPFRSIYWLTQIFDAKLISNFDLVFCVFHLLHILCFCFNSKIGALNQFCVIAFLIGEMKKLCWQLPYAIRWVLRSELKLLFEKKEKKITN